MTTVNFLVPKYQQILVGLYVFMHVPKNLPLTARFPFSETSNLLVAGMSRTSSWTEPEWSRNIKREFRDKIRWPQNWKSSSSSGHHNQRSPGPLISMLTSLLPCTYQSLVGWWPYGWWYLQRLQVSFPWQPLDFSPGYAMLASSNPLLGRGHAHQCSVQSGSCLLTLGLCLLLVKGDLDIMWSDTTRKHFV